MLTTVKVRSEGGVLVSKRQLELPLFAEIIDTEQNLSNTAGAGAELALPDVVLM
jgi:hypothetical protein